MLQKTFTYDQRFELESGQSLDGLQIAYHTFGTLNRERNNVIWVCHALTANSNVVEWWKGLFGEGCYFNPEDHFIVCANNLGSCYGTTGPLSINPLTREPWYSYFPNLTTRDLARTLALLQHHLGIDNIHTLIGGSQGGQIALEWSLLQPTLISNLILIATNAQHSPWGIAFNESQRLAIKADRTYYANVEGAAQKGLSAARSIALLSYRGYETYEATQKEKDQNRTNDYAAASYQRYQGEKLAARFNAYSYVRLLEAMDSHHVARKRATSVEDALRKVKAHTLVIGIKRDLLFQTSEQKFLARLIPGAHYAEIDSLYGHDGFLIETVALTRVINRHFTTQHGKTNHFNLQQISLY